ncbi:MAG TPA: helix-turn-helix transcriptional regulator [Thermoanaerobaculia bacterium]
MPRKKRPRQPPSPRNVTRKALREVLDLTQAEAAEKAGLSPRTVNRLETMPDSGGAEEARYLAGMNYETVDADVVEAALIQTQDPAAPPGSPADPSLDELRLIRRLAGDAGAHAFRTTEEHLRELVPLWRRTRARLQAVGLCETLLALPTKRRRLRIEKVRQFQTWAVAERLCLLSEQVAPQKAELAVERAKLACLAADWADVDDLFRPRLQGFCLFYLGNAERVSGHPSQADATFARASSLWEQGAAADPGRLLPAWRVLDLEASLRRDQRRFEHALDLLDRARAAAPKAAHGRILLKKSSILAMMDEPERALEALREAEPRVEAQGDRRQLWVHRFNLARCLCDLGKYKEAESRLPEVRALTMELRNETDLWRVRWLEAKVLAGFGQTDEAREALEQVRRAFAAPAIAYDGALVSLELALLHLKEGDTGRVKTLAEEMMWIFEAEGVPDNALAALTVFCQAAKQEAATVDLTQRILRFLERAQHDPSLRFED